jgi:hypothetical protein
MVTHRNSQAADQHQRKLVVIVRIGKVGNSSPPGAHSTSAVASPWSFTSSSSEMWFRCRTWTSASPSGSIELILNTASRLKRQFVKVD